MRIKIENLGEQIKLKFGTSGIRGLATDMTDFACYAYTIGFLKYLENNKKIKRNETAIAIGGDFRPSTDRIMSAVAKAVTDIGYKAVNCGKVPTPAIAFYSIEQKIPCIMVTGSHIPDDRNGIKFYKASGEVLKDDEAKILEQVIDINDELFNKNGNFKINNNNEIFRKETIQKKVEDLYIKRYIDFFPENALSGKNIGVYQHSAVGREVIYKIITGLGAKATKLGFSDKFIPVDTEAIREEDIIAAKKWAAEYKFDAIISTDGDSDRPLISDETGNWIRGDISGILCAKYLEADSVVTTVSCNSAIDKSGWFDNIKRTKIGSPYIIASMIDELKKGYKNIVGYEANGGFLTGSKIIKDGRILNPLPTRDAVISPLSILMLSIIEKKSISQIVGSLPKRFTSSERIQNFPVEKSNLVLANFSNKNEEVNKTAILNFFGNSYGKVTKIDRTDGIRIYFENDEIIHLRPSGNAPEFRCYNEASDEKRVKELNKLCIEKIKVMNI